MTGDNAYFAMPQALWLLLFLPVWWGAMRWSRRRAAERLLRMMTAKDLERLLPVPQGHPHDQRWLLLALCALIVALARPHYGYEWREVKKRGTDIMVLMDVSKSMLATDVKPNRLERAKRKLRDLLRLAQGDRVGIIVFAGEAFVLCPLTNDYGAVQLFADSVDMNTIPVPGSSLGKAIGIAVQSLKVGTDEGSQGKSILLLTDGEDQGSEPLKAAEQAAKEHVRIFALGIGSPSGAPIPDEQGGFKTDQQGRTVVTKLDAGTLEKIAQAGDGRYAPSTAGDEDLIATYQQGIRRGAKLATLQVEKQRLYRELFPWFLALSLLCLLRAWTPRAIRRFPVDDVLPRPTRGGATRQYRVLG